LGWGPHGLNKGTKSQFTSNRETRWTDPVTARRVPSKWIKGNKGSKGLSHVYITCLVSCT
jgi:hypothetical protein